MELQICREPQQSPQAWEPVNDVSGAFVVNIGDMLERWTNGKWKSTLHRVILPEGVERTDTLCLTSSSPTLSA